jgi:hypothetical protein
MRHFSVVCDRVHRNFVLNTTMSVADKLLENIQSFNSLTQLNRVLAIDKHFTRFSRLSATVKQPPHDTAVTKSSIALTLIISTPTNHYSIQCHCGHVQGIVWWGQMAVVSVLCRLDFKMLSPSVVETLTQRTNARRKCGLLGVESLQPM